MQVVPFCNNPLQVPYSQTIGKPNKIKVLEDKYKKKPVKIGYEYWCLIEIDIKLEQNAHLALNAVLKQQIL